VTWDARFDELPIIIFSSSAQVSYQERARELGATDYWVKPTNVDQLIELAKELNRRWLVKA
jgi:DNA-binding response OmpR family regulator